MVSVMEFLFVNASSILFTGLSFVTIMVCYLFYSKTRHTGFLIILIGFTISMFWSLFYLFVLQGAYFSSNLANSGMPVNEIAFWSFFISLVRMVFTFINNIML
ncbi:MAG: hypothetical protein ACTSW1_14835, partial [Candidatus Hodarchaeales archaeon]